MQCVQDCHNTFLNVGYSVIIVDIIQFTPTNAHSFVKIAIIIIQLCAFVGVNCNN